MNTNNKQTMAENVSLGSSESQLHSCMESLKLDSEEAKKSTVLTLNEHESTSVTQRMTLRKKKRVSLESGKRRVQIEPTKLSPILGDEESLKQFYINVNKKFKVSPKVCLETIFEEPHSKMDKVIYLGTRKIRRALNLKGNTPLNSKIKKRKTKIKKFFGKLNHFKSVSDAQLISQLAALDENED